MWNEIGYGGETAAKDFKKAFEYVSWLKQLHGEPLGEGRWSTVDLEEVFTAVEIEREFLGQESSSEELYTAARNQLVRYISRILAFCHQDMYGIYTRKLAEFLEPPDSVLSFNYDLLIDQEMLLRSTLTYYPHYNRFFTRISHSAWPDPIEKEGPDGMLLKLHGSLNWFKCTNSQCPASSQIQLVRDTGECLNRSLGIHAEDEDCLLCGSEKVALIVPPLLKKPIVDNWIFRSIWGMARRRLEEATHVVIIGYSAPPSDFYARWLLQSKIGTRRDIKPIVVNPANRQDHPDFKEFTGRMRALFPHGYDSTFLTYDQLDDVLKAMQS